MLFTTAAILQSQIIYPAMFDIKCDAYYNQIPVYMVKLTLGNQVIPKKLIFTSFY